MKRTIVKYYGLKNETFFFSYDLCHSCENENDYFMIVLHRFCLPDFAMVDVHDLCIYFPHTYSLPSLFICMTLGVRVNT
jgi:hypothetical protein